MHPAASTRTKSHLHKQFKGVHTAAMSRRSADPTDPAEIGHRLRMLRLALGHTQAAMARFAGTKGINPAGLWNNYESGTRRINTDGAMQLCRTFGLSMDWIYLGNIGTLSGPIREKIEDQMRSAPPRHSSRRRRQV
jgi:transcriptional regulator with XRE-family HTH domain